MSLSLSKELSSSLSLVLDEKKTLSAQDIINFILVFMRFVVTQPNIHIQYVTGASFPSTLKHLLREIIKQLSPNSLSPLKAFLNTILLKCPGIMLLVKQNSPCASESQHDKFYYLVSESLQKLHSLLSDEIKKPQRQFQDSLSYESLKANLDALESELFAPTPTPPSPLPPGAYFATDDLLSTPQERQASPNQHLLTEVAARLPISVLPEDQPDAILVKNVAKIIQDCLGLLPPDDQLDADRALTVFESTLSERLKKYSPDILEAAYIAITKKPTMLIALLCFVDNPVTISVEKLEDCLNNSYSADFSGKVQSFVDNLPDKSDVIAYLQGNAAKILNALTFLYGKIQEGLSQEAKNQFSLPEQEGLIAVLEDHVKQNPTVVPPSIRDILLGILIQHSADYAAEISTFRKELRDLASPIPIVDSAPPQTLPKTNPDIAPRVQKRNSRKKIFAALCLAAAAVSAIASVVLSATGIFSIFGALCAKMSWSLGAKAVEIYAADALIGAAVGTALITGPVVTCTANRNRRKKGGPASAPTTPQKSFLLNADEFKTRVLQALGHRIQQLQREQKKGGWHQDLKAKKIAALDNLQTALSKASPDAISATIEAAKNQNPSLIKCGCCLFWKRQSRTGRLFDEIRKWDKRVNPPTTRQLTFSP